MKLLVVSVAALGHSLWERRHKADFWRKLRPRPAATCFPALTCPVQSSFRTGHGPESHGMIANGFFDRSLCRALFWEQSSNLCEGPRIWEDFRIHGGKVGQICWQQSIGNDSDLFLSPSPIHKHHGGMIQDCASRPAGLYRELCKQTGKKFNLLDYWGPFTSLKSSAWIAKATISLIGSGRAPELLLSYIPHLDYELQRHGPDHPSAEKAFRETELLLEKLCAAAVLAGYEILIFGDYAITPATRVVHPNRLLRDWGYFEPRIVQGKLYASLATAKAFALADHQIAHIFIEREKDIAPIRERFAKLPGIDRVLDHREISHPRSGELILKAEPGTWFAYPWWDKRSEAPDYASHVDIHNKPGFDPCELLIDWWPPFSVAQNAALIKGTHGLAGTSETAVLAASSFELPGNSSSIIAIAQNVKSMLSHAGLQS